MINNKPRVFKEEKFNIPAFVGQYTVRLPFNEVRSHHSDNKAKIKSNTRVYCQFLNVS